MNDVIFYQGQEEAINKIIQNCNGIIVADARTNGFCVPVANKILCALKPFPIITIPAGEENKNIETVQFLWQEFQRFSIHKKNTIIAIGGGCLLDIVNFAASTYMRGIETINIPTTLLSMVDASIGGKSGINFLNIKNNIGSFHFAKHVFVHPVFLNTLPDRELHAGIAEMIKHAMISDENLWNQYKNYSSIFEFIDIENIKKSLAIKINIVQQDVHDEHIRKTLNFGHSIGHAIEACAATTKNPLLHGEAIMLGLLLELRLSEMIFSIPEKIRVDFYKILRRFFPTLQLEIQEKALLSKIYFDKKNDAQIKMSILKDIANCTFDFPITEKQIKDALKII